MTTIDAQIKFKDSEKIENVSFAVGAYKKGTNDDDVFFWVESRDELLDLKMYDNGEDFVVVEVEKINWKIQEKTLAEKNEMIQKFVEGKVHTKGDSEYQNDWNGIMAVIDKIREKQTFCFINILNQAMKEGCEIRVFDIENNDLFHTYPKVNTQEKTILSVTFDAIVEFVEWYRSK